MPNDISSVAATASGSQPRDKTLQSEPPCTVTTTSQQATSHPTKNLRCIDNDVKFIQRHGEQGTTHPAEDLQYLDSDPEFTPNHGAQETATPTKKKNPVHRQRPQIRRKVRQEALMSRVATAQETKGAFLPAGNQYSESKQELAGRYRDGHWNPQPSTQGGKGQSTAGYRGYSCRRRPWSDSAAPRRNGQAQQPSLVVTCGRSK